MIVIKSRKKERKKERKKKNEKSDKKGTRIRHMTERKRRQNLAKCCSVYFQTWMNQWNWWNCSEMNEVAQVLGKNLLIIGSEQSVWFFLKHVHCCNHRQSGLKLTVRFHHINCGSWTEQVYNPFAQRRHHVPVWTSWRKNLNLNR